MAEYCPNCFGVLDGFHVCSEATTSKSGGSDRSYLSENKSLQNLVLLAPFTGLIVDLVLPLPSSLVHSILTTLLGCMAAGAIWVTVKHQGSKSAMFYIKNLKNFAYTPNMIKIFGFGDAKKTGTGWVIAVIASTAIQILIFTPGNASYLSHQVTKKIDDASGANLKVDCPGPKIYFYNEKIECRVKTGLLGITVPARATLSPFLGTSEIKVSLF